MPIAGEVSGIIVELPTDPVLLESETYKSRGFKKGGKVALVLFHNICTALRSLLHRSDYVLIEHQGLPEGICCCTLVGLALMAIHGFGAEPNSVHRNEMIVAVPDAVSARVAAAAFIQVDCTSYASRQC